MCFAGFQPLSNSVRQTPSGNMSRRVGGKDLLVCGAGTSEGVAVGRPRSVGQIRGRGLNGRGLQEGHW